MSPDLSRAPAIDAQLFVPLTSDDFGFSAIRKETILRAAWANVTARHTSSPDVIFFTSFDEHNPWLAPVRLHIPVNARVSEWLGELEGKVKEAEDNGTFPTELMVEMEKASLTRSLPTFLVISPAAETFPPRHQIKGPLMVVARLDISRLELHYDSKWFSKAEVQALGNHFNIVLQGMIAAPESAVGNLPLLTEKERKLLLDEWNKTAVPFAETTCVHEFFEAQVARTPEAIAVVFCDRQWTYRELNAQADIVADRLRTAGVGHGALAAICMNRSLELIATLFAVFKTGAAYVPLDPAYPSERLAFMIDDAKPAVIVVTQQTTELFSQRPNLFLLDTLGDEATMEVSKNSTPSKSSDAAYVLYTSGSTGKPKGVIITHRNVSNFFTAMDAVIGTHPGVWLAVTSINFDISVFELFWTLARGFRVILQEEGQWASQSGSKYSLHQQLKRHAVTHLQCTPSLASMLLSDIESAVAIKGLRRFMIGGEPLPLDLAQNLSASIAGELVNLYGPTETTVWSASQIIGRKDNKISIGRPVANNRLYVLDSQRELVPIGSIGELYIGGDGLAQGYLNRPELTQERFITHHFSAVQSERLYRTGDLVRYLPDGRLEFVGRVDQQIKIRGVRVELGEIEVVLRENPEIRDAAVIVQELEADDKRLIAYVVPSSAQSPVVSELQQWLATKLPKILVPSAIIVLPEFPKTPNGKLDRRALPKPDQNNSPVVEGAANDLERQIAAIWCEALGLQSVGLDDRFFDIGGHSLLMIEVHDQIRDNAGHNVALLDLFQYPTIRSLARFLNQRSLRQTVGATGLNRGKLRHKLTARQGPIRKAVSANES